MNHFKTDDLRVKATRLFGLVLLLALYAPLTASMADLATISPGEVWSDSNGNEIQAHAPGIIKVGRVWYWFGEDKTNGADFQNINCYSSTDLVHWTYQSHALSRQTSGDLGPHRVIERPKVLYNKRTHMYVMYVHVDDSQYREAKVGVATSRSVTGPYSYNGSFSPLGHQSRDMTIWADDDDTGYLIFEDRARGVCIAQLSPDYLSVVAQVALIPHAYEAPAMVKVGGTYFLLGSHLSGWSTNPNQYTTSRSLAGPWSEYKDLAPGSPNTFDSQTAFVLTVKGRRTTSYIYLGDRWKSNNLADSRYIWLPLHISNGTAQISQPEPWTIDTKTGVVNPAK